MNEQELKERVEGFRSNWNTDISDWIFTEDTIICGDIIFAAFNREYNVRADQTGHSMVYAFSGDTKERIYYRKYYDGQPKWNDPGNHVTSLVSAERDGDEITVMVETGDGDQKALNFTV